MDRLALIAAMQATAAVRPLPVVVPGWGTVYVRALTVADVEEQAGDGAPAAEADVPTTPPADRHRIARSVARLLCDAEGARLFNPADEADVALIAAQPWALLRGILAKANALNGTTDEAQASLGNG